MCDNKPSVGVITGREAVLGATLALITLTVWHRCSEVRTDMPAFGVASVSLNLTLADLQSGVVQSVPGSQHRSTAAGETAGRSLRS